MDTVRLGLVGCGFAARDLYEPAFRYLQGEKLTAVMDLDAERAREIAPWPP